MAQMNALALALGALLALPAAAQDRSQEAREASARGDTAAAISIMREHLAAHPDDAAAKKDLARYYIWTGAYIEADALLSPMADGDAEARSLLAYNAAWAGRIDRALALNADGLARDAGDFQANYTQAIALRQTARAYTAWPHVETVERAKPGSRDATDLRTGTRQRTASEVSLSWGLSDDSDDIRADRVGLSAAIDVAQDWRLLADWSTGSYRAPIGGGYQPVSGGTRIDEDQLWLGASYTPAQDTVITAMAGRSRTDLESDTLGLLRIDQRVNDDWRFSLGADRDRLGISPRSVSLGLMRDRYLAQVRYTPDLHWTADALFSRQDISDGNARSEVQLAVRRAVVRSPRAWLDIGGEVQWLSYDEAPGTGYYAPDNYRRFALTASAYLPVSQDAGFSLRAGAGLQRDETFSGWESANDLGVDFTSRFARDWQLQISAGYSNRAQAAGVYDARSFGVRLRKQF
jgi:hypothetical protein